jgi:tetratricopeptide (TPR) repeat protein
MSRLHAIWLSAATAALVAACGQGPRPSAADLDRLPDYQRARKAAEAGDFRAAAGFYQQVVRAAPEAARAHLELGLLYDEKLGDPIAAIYHYRQFLELEPNSNRRDIVESYIERSKLTLAAKLPQAPGIDPVELTRLQTENAMLRGRIAELESRAAAVPSGADLPAQLPAGQPVAAQPPGTAVAAPAAPATSRTHWVQKGDTLQSLALRYYGSRAAWEKIYAANRTSLASKDQLKVGQPLVIP